jgi:hypothetical protein
LEGRDQCVVGEYRAVALGAEASCGGGCGAAARGEKPLDSVYLDDLLWGFQGNLYVPEEVFESRTFELEDYAQQLESLPEMSFEEFLRAARAWKIEMLVSCGVTLVDVWQFR